MKKLIMAVGTWLLIWGMVSPGYSQDLTPGGQSQSPLEGYTGADGREIKPGKQMDRYATKALSKTFTSKVTYKAGPQETERSCRIIAKEQAKRNLAEEITDEVVGYYDVEYVAKFNKDPIERNDFIPVVPCLVEFKIDSDKWGNNKLKNKVSVTAGVDELIKLKAAINNDKSMMTYIKNNRHLANEAYETILQLKKAKGNFDQKTYDQAVNQLAAVDSFERGLFSAFGKNNQAALDAFTEAVNMHPEYPEAIYYRGVLHYSFKKDPEKAIADFDQAIALKENDPNFYESRGICYLEAENLDQALEDFNRGIELNPESVSLLSDRGMAYEKINDLTKALSDYGKVIELDPDNIRAHYRIGMIHKQQKDYNLCIKDFGKVISLNERFAPAFYERAMAYAYLKDEANKGKVIEDFKSAARLGHNTAQDVLKSLDVEW